MPANIAQIMRAILEFGRQSVCINVPNKNYEQIVRKTLAEAKVRPALVQTFVRFFYIPTNEGWCRDHGPAFVVKPAGVGAPRQVAIVDWGFNAWGDKYPPYEDDDAVPTRIAEMLQLPIFYPKLGGRPVVMEGGAVEFNGRGTILTTRSCLLHPNRNPHLKEPQIERLLKDYYGQQHVCWLGEGIVGDDTDGHIDGLARFLNPTTLVVALEDDRHDANYKILRENLQRAQFLRDQDGNPFEIVTIPMPGVVEHKEQRLPATYLNFLFVNNACLVPTFRHRVNDRKALGILQRHLPKHEVVGIDCTELIWGLGAIHCLTQQQPR